MTRSPDGFGPLPPGDWPDSLDDLRDDFAGRLNVYRVMANHPGLLRGWAPLRYHIVQDNALGPELLEIAVLRIAHRLGSRYEWAHHVSRSRALGLADDRIAGMRGAPEHMAPDDALIARGVDQILADARLSPELRDALAGALGVPAVFDLIATAGFYLTLAGLAESLGTPLDEGLAADFWDTP